MNIRPEDIFNLAQANERKDARKAAALARLAREKQIAASRSQLAEMINRLDAVVDKLSLEALHEAASSGKTHVEVELDDQAFAVMQRDPIDHIPDHQGRSDYTFLHYWDIPTKGFQFKHGPAIPCKFFERINELLEQGFRLSFDDGYRDDESDYEAPHYYRAYAPRVTIRLTPRKT